MKIQAYQVPPEYQISPLIQFDEFPDDISVYGNPRYNGCKSDLFSNLPHILDEMLTEFHHLKNGDRYYTAFSFILEEFTGHAYYTRSERKMWVDLLQRWGETDEETGVFLDALRLITGKEYAHATIWGCCQGDWQYIIYPTEYGDEWLKSFEIEYFNLGTEWTVKEDDETEFTIYCTNDDPRAEIADATGADPGDVILYNFDGWTRTPKYKEVQA